MVDVAMKSSLQSKWIFENFNLFSSYSFLGNCIHQSTNARRVVHLFYLIRDMFSDSLEPVMNQLTTMHLEQNSFIVTSVIGQELLSHNYTADAVKV